MRPECRKYLYDIREACELLSRFAAGKSFDDYRADPLLRSAVERQSAIIGETVSQMLKVDPDLSRAISESGRIIAFRNILVHRYASVSDEVVWGVLTADLPRLLAEVNTLLGSGKP